MATVIPGSAASHNIITPNCREGRGEQGAWDEAVARAKREYDAMLDHWTTNEVDPQPDLHLVLVVDWPQRRTAGGPESQVAPDQLADEERSAPPAASAEGN